MRPRLGNRGSDIRERLDSVLGAASMRPRLGNRGSFEVRARPGEAGAGFNEAPAW